MAATKRWRNWSREHACRPTAYHEPTEQDEIAALLRSSGLQGRRLRLVGGGHSWSPLACTDDEMVSLDRHNRVLGVDHEARTITVEAGIRLWQLNEALDRHGLALANMGSIDKQSLAGVISTATHGTGGNLGCLSTQVESLELITASGNIVRCSADEEPEIFAGVRCGLGALGVISTVTLNVIPAFNLHSVEEKRTLDGGLAELEDLVETHEHFKLWWVPSTGHCLLFRQNHTAEPRNRSRLRKWFDQQVLRNLVLELGLGVSARIPRTLPGLYRALMAGTPARAEYVDRSDRVFTFPVKVRHHEAEHAIPREAATEALRGLRDLIAARGLRASMIVEVRFVAGDDIWLSPATGRESCFIGFLQHRALPYEPYFRAAEEFLDRFGARPHWGKTHFKGPAQLRGLYPRWDDFLALRRRLDPDRRFVTPYLSGLLGI